MQLIILVSNLYIPTFKYQEIHLRCYVISLYGGFECVPIAWSHYCIYIVHCYDWWLTIVANPLVIPNTCLIVLQWDTTIGEWTYHYSESFNDSDLSQNDSRGHSNSGKDDLKDCRRSKSTHGLGQHGSRTLRWYCEQLCWTYQGCFEPERVLYSFLISELPKVTFFTHLLLICESLYHYDDSDFVY